MPAQDIFLNLRTPADALLTPNGVQRAQAVHDKWLSEVGLPRIPPETRSLTTPQIPSGIPIPTVLYSSPLTRASRTLEITWTGITLQNGSHHGLLYPSHKVLIAEVRSRRQCSALFRFTICPRRTVVKLMVCTPATSVIPSLGSRGTSLRLHSTKVLPKK